MSRRTEDLIADLAAKAGPVRRLAPPMARALAWLGVVALIAAAMIWKLSNLHVLATRTADPRLDAEMFATLTTGVAGVIAAFHLSLPDRPRAWALLPAPFVALWLVASGAECWRSWAEQTANGWRLGQSSHCFVFLLAVGAPLAALLLVGLRRAHPLQPRLTAAVGAVGISGLAAFLLQFFHPFDVTLLDLGAHLAAVAILIGVFSLSGRRALS